MSSSVQDRGTPFVVVGWCLSAVVVPAFCIRIYSRSFITQSVGSDDFAISFSVVLTVAGEIADTFQYRNGLGKHETNLTPAQFSTAQKWEFIDWLMVYISFFFLRASVMLFVLRLLPSYAKWKPKIIYLVFFLSWAITMIATLMYGLACIPFRALYESVPGARCYRKSLLVIAAQVNGILSCIVDIITAALPFFLLWNVQMKPRTKLVLNCIFLLGLVTAAMSIGRAATTKTSYLESDSTWQFIPFDWFGMIEEKFGIIFACAPAIRQFLAYYQRTGSLLPTKMRQYPNEDFVKLRRRVNLRDIFWYRKADSRGGRVFDAKPIFKVASELPRNRDNNAPEVKRSVMDRIERACRRLFSSHSCSKTHALSSDRNSLVHGRNRTIESESSQERSKIERKYTAWGLISSKDNTHHGNRGDRDSDLETASQDPQTDVELVEMLQKPQGLKTAA